MSMFTPEHERFIDTKIRDLARRSSVVDIGGGERFQKWLAPYRALFSETDYRTLDSDPSSGADIVGDIHAIPLADGSVDAVICHSVLEHVRDPARATKEIHRILKTGGVLFLHVPSIYPYHARTGVYPDLWRFFDDTLDLLLDGFSEIEIAKRGGYFTALFFFCPFQHKLRWLIDPLATFLDRVFRTRKRTTTAGYYVWAVKGEGAGGRL